MPPELERLVSLFGPYVHRYGYFTAFFGMMLENAGIPVPAESALIVLAIFASRHVLLLRYLIPIAVAGDVCGDNIGYLVGRFGGRPLAKRFGRYVRIDQAKIMKMESYFGRRGGSTVFFLHFFATTRIVVALSAGIARMRYRRFLFFNICGSVVFVSTLLVLFDLFSKKLDVILRITHGARVLGLIVVIFVIVVYFTRRYLERRMNP